MKADDTVDETGSDLAAMTFLVSYDLAAMTSQLVCKYCPCHDLME